MTSSPIRTFLHHVERRVLLHHRTATATIPSRFLKSLGAVNTTPFRTRTFATTSHTQQQQQEQQHHDHDIVYPPLNRNEIRGEFGEYQKEYDRSITSLGDFWMDASKKLTWFDEPTISIQQRAGDNNNQYFYDWFPDGTINTSYNCLDVHVQSGRGDQIALIYDSPLTNNTKEQYTYNELLDKVSTFAGALQNDLGVQKGDRVIIYMPLIPQAAIAMLACARIGAVHSVVFGGFAANELASRITDCNPKVIITASCGVEPTRIVEYRPIIDDALKLTKNHKVDKVVVVQRSNVQECDLRPIDVDYDDLMSTASPVEATPLPATHPHYILYTSGTTG